MTITARIDEDIKCLNKYFHKLFEVLNEAVKEEHNAPIEVVDAGTLESQLSFFRVSHFIKPDMVINIYGLIDFWMKDICEYQRKKHNPNLTYRDIKGNGDLDIFQKYLTKVVGLDLTSVSDSYRHLDNLRIVRNKFIHNGGHVLDEKEQKRLSNCNGIRIGLGLIEIEDHFIWNSLDHAKIYLFEAAK